MKKNQSLISGLLVCALCAALLITGTMGSFVPAMADVNAATADVNAATADSTAAAVTDTAITAVGATATGASVTATGTAVAADGVVYEYRDMKRYENAVVIEKIALPDGMTELVIPETLDGKDVVNLTLKESNTQIKKVVLPKKIRLLPRMYSYGYDIFYSLVELYSLEEIEVDEENAELTAEDGILYDKEMKKMLVYPKMKTATVYDMPDSVVETDGNICNPFLRSISFSENPEYKKATGCVNCDNLESADLPDNVSEVGGFVGCDKLVRVRFSKNLKKIHDGAFEGCISLTEISLPDGLEEIEADAFRWCHNLKKVELPDSVNFVGGKAFSEVSAKNIKRSKYLISPRNKKIAKYYDERSRRSSHRFERAVTLKRKGKTYYFPYWKIWGIEPSKKRETLKAGKTKKLSVVGYIQEGSGYKKGTMPAKFLTFSSSDSRVASVTSKGKIKGKKKGTAVIKVRYPKGEYVDGRCKIRVRVK